MLWIVLNFLIFRSIFSLNFGCLRDEELGQRSDSLFPIHDKVHWWNYLRTDFEGRNFSLFGPVGLWDLSSQAGAPAVEAQYPKHWTCREFQREDSKALGHWWSEILRALVLTKGLTFRPQSPTLYSPPPNTLAPSQRIWWRTQKGICSPGIQRNITWVTFLGPNFKNTSIHFVPLVLTGHYQCDEMSKYFLQRQKKIKIRSLGPAVGHDPNLKVQLPPSFLARILAGARFRSLSNQLMLLLKMCSSHGRSYFQGFRHWG